MQTYNMPDIDADVRNLVPESASGVELKPDTPVLVVHRGRHVITDKFDGIDYRILPGYTRMPYGAARHFQSRGVIPGTRNPELGFEQSYLGIVGLDDDWMVQPLTDEEVDRFGAAIEAIDRSSFTDPTDRQVTVLRTGSGPQRRGQGKRPAISAQVQATPGAEEAAAHIFDTPDENDARTAVDDLASAIDDGEDEPAPARKAKRR